MTARYRALAARHGLDPARVDVMEVGFDEAMRTRGWLDTQTPDEMPPGPAPRPRLVPPLTEAADEPAATPTLEVEPNRWTEHWVRIPQEAITGTESTKRLTPTQLLGLAALIRMRENVMHDICARVEDLCDRTGMTRATLRRHLSPGGIYYPWVRLRTDWIATGPDKDGTQSNLTEVPAHIRYDVDGREQWRLDVTDPQTTWHRAYYWWLWEDPTTTENADRWTRTTVRPLALAGALHVAVCSTGDWRTSRNYGVQGTATRTRRGLTHQQSLLNAAEEDGLIAVDHRQGRHSARRTVRWHPNDATSTTARRNRVPARPATDPRDGKQP